MDHSVIHETKTHGKLSFPYTVYCGNIPEFLHSYPLHWHDEMEIIYVTGGKGIVTIQTGEYTAQTGDLLILPPQIVHSMKQLGNESMTYFNILFHFSLLNGSDNCYEKYIRPFYEHTRTVPPYFPADSEPNRLMLPYISDLISSRKQRYTGYELMIKSHLFALMHYLNLYSAQISNGELSLQSTYDKLKKLLLYIQDNYSRPISVAAAADVCGFSESHFMKLFKELTGRTFTQYLKDFRLEIAADQLTGSSRKIIEIAENTGFANHSYFTRSFIARYGVSPSDYRMRTAPTP